MERSDAACAKLRQGQVATQNLGPTIPPVASVLFCAPARTLIRFLPDLSLSPGAWSEAAFSAAPATARKRLLVVTCHAFENASLDHPQLRRHAAGAPPSPPSRYVYTGSIMLCRCFADA